MGIAWQIMLLILEYRPTFEELAALAEKIRGLFNPQVVGEDVRFAMASRANVDMACDGQSEFVTKAIALYAKAANTPS